MAEERGFIGIPQWMDLPQMISVLNNNASSPIDALKNRANRCRTRIDAPPDKLSPEPVEKPVSPP
jgi:hypothetical protein